VKVLHLGRFYTSHFGGIERHVALLLQELGRSIHVDNLVATEKSAPRTIVKENYRIITTPSLGMLARTAISPAMLLTAKQLHQVENYDIIHLHFPDPLSHLIAYCLPKQVKKVITWHSDIIKQKKLLKFYKPFLQHILNQCDAIIAATPRHFAEETQLAQLLNHQRTHVIPFGIDYQPFTQPAAAIAGQAIKQQYPRKKIIFAIGRHVYYKGFSYLLKAMQQIPEAVLLLGGSGPLTPELQALAKELHLQKQVIFLGRIAEEDLPAYYHAADIFCMPSVEPSEAFGLVQLEAMACKKPIVCCELNNGVTYVNQHGITGLVVPPKDIDALAGALLSLCQNEALGHQLGQAGYQRAMTEFTLDRMRQKTLDVYQQVLKEDFLN
jgi:rhamnosyl/mannosyltransferase